VNHSGELGIVKAEPDDREEVLDVQPADPLLS
jgi:hypothetical protein